MGRDGMVPRAAAQLKKTLGSRNLSVGLNAKHNMPKRFPLLLFAVNSEQHRMCMIMESCFVHDLEYRTSMRLPVVAPCERCYEYEKLSHRDGGCLKPPWTN